jgi:hypothetical protein
MKVVPNSNSSSSEAAQPQSSQQKAAGSDGGSADIEEDSLESFTRVMPVWRLLVAVVDSISQLDNHLTESLLDVPLLPPGSRASLKDLAWVWGEWGRLLGQLADDLKSSCKIAGIPSTAIAMEVLRAVVRDHKIDVVPSDVAKAVSLFFKRVEELLLSRVRLHMLDHLSALGEDLRTFAAQVERQLAELGKRIKQQLRESELGQEKDQPQQQQSGGRGDNATTSPDGPLPLKQLLLLQTFPRWSGHGGSDAKGLVGAALLNQQFTFAEAAVAGNAAGDPNWWAADRGVRDWPDLTLKPAMCFARGRLTQMCVDLVREKQLGKEPIWDWEEGKDADPDIEFLGVVPPFRWLSWRQQQVLNEKYQAEQHQMSQLELQLRYMPHLDHGVLRPRQIQEQQQQEGQGERAPEQGGELEMKEDVVKAVLRLLDVPGIPKDWLLQWMKRRVKAGVMTADTAVLVELLTTLGAAESLPGGAGFEGNGGLGEKLMCCPGAVDLFGAMTAWSARVCPYTC